ncbi:MAG: site-specific DNA-methyltransferase [Victivallales bacterium]|nr:site-specific DNA-methyltransferase [Victivallales bacterium]
MKPRAPRNRTLTLTEDERIRLSRKLLRVPQEWTADAMADRVIQADLFDVLDQLPEQFADLLILDPPYNLDKQFADRKFGRRSHDEYLQYLESWFPRLLKVLRPHASVYLCGDWQCSAADFQVMAKYLKVRNRITWQREKGRGAQNNWKNCCEDIWFATVGNKYYFDVDAVKQKRRVIAPYRENGRPKDWQETSEGNYRLTCPSNFWDDISVPYWSMPENTDHPTQKPEKLLAKLILASSRPGDLVFDPFLGSGTTAVVAKKLGRHFTGIEINQEYCRWALKRLERAETDTTIQGYRDGVFWERNTLKKPPRK